MGFTRVWLKTFYADTIFEYFLIIFAQENAENAQGLLNLTKLRDWYYCNYEVFPIKIKSFID